MGASQPSVIAPLVKALGERCAALLDIGPCLALPAPHFPLAANFLATLAYFRSMMAW